MGQSESAVNHPMRLLGRHGVLSATTVGPHRDSPDLSSMKKLLQAVSFKPSQGYADYQKGDKLAGVGLVELVTADSSLTMGADSSASADAADAGGGKTFW